MALIKGEFSYFASQPKLLENLTDVHLGKFCSCASGIIFDCGAQHRSEFCSQYPFNKIFPECYHISGHPKSFGVTKIFNDVWLSENVFVMSGVTISNGVVVGAGAVVTKDVPPYAIAVGVPARVVKYRFSQDKIDILQKIQWWDFPIEIIKKIAPILMSEDIYKLEEIYNDLKSKKII